MRRRLFNVLAGVSLVLFMVTAGIWARTYWRQDQFQTVSRRYDFDTTPGRVWLDYSNPPYFAGSGYRARPVANDRFGQQFHGFFTIMPAPGGRSYAVCGFVYLTYLQPGRPWPPMPDALTFMMGNHPAPLPGDLFYCKNHMWCRPGADGAGAGEVVGSARHDDEGADGERRRTERRREAPEVDLAELGPHAQEPFAKLRARVDGGAGAHRGEEEQQRECLEYVEASHEHL